MSEKNDNEHEHDLVMLHGPTDDGEGVTALRSRSGKMELAEIRPMKDGVDVSRNEIVSLKPHEDAPFLCDVETVYSPEEIEESDRGANAHAGPPRVSSDSYRKNWGKIFTAKRGAKKPLLN